MNLFTETNKQRSRKSYPRRPTDYVGVGNKANELFLVVGYRNTYRRNVMSRTATSVMWSTVSAAWQTWRCLSSSADAGSNWLYDDDTGSSTFLKLSRRGRGTSFYVNGTVLDGLMLI